MRRRASASAVASTVSSAAGSRNSLENYRLSSELVDETIMKRNNPTNAYVVSARYYAQSTDELDLSEGQMMGAPEHLFDDGWAYGRLISSPGDATPPREGALKKLGWFPEKYCKQKDAAPGDVEYY